ncbi:nucleotidyltransferase family protein [Terracidiphilus gabretensis]|uniref:nucleotidyltransferase family protein n=1 Tax=Terracidiphilus gabretensis TaxID=1577687 RepID=UPI00071BD6BD|nr:nucleotidyltransferase family protein [Terracidiphilus gabretensis]
MKVGAIILAAGASRRLGRAKQLISYEGEMLLTRVLRLVREACLAHTVVVLGAEREAIAAAVDLSGVRVVRNEDWVRGIAGSIHAGLRALEEVDADVDGALILTCDQPRLSVSHLRALVAAFDARGGRDIAASEYAGGVGVPAIFPRCMFAELYALSGDKGARVQLKDARVVMRVDFPGGEVDVDTPEDLEALE